MRVSAKRNVKKVLQNTGIIIFVITIIFGFQADQNSVFSVFNNNNNTTFRYKSPRSQASFEGSSLNSGGMNVSLQQSYTNLTDISIDQDLNSFTVPAPSSSDYTTDKINITLKDLTSHNYTDVIEDSSRSGRISVLDAAPLVTSFTVPTNCYLVNASFDLRPSGTSTDIRVRIWNSIWIAGTSKPSGYYDYQAYENVTVDGIGWKSTSNNSFYLDNSNTDNNTWFIGLYDENTPSFQADWYYNDDQVGDGTNDSLSYQWSVTDWVLVTDISTVDFNTKIGLSLKTTGPNPSDINLMINSTAVSDVTGNKGEWTNTTSYSGTNGKLNFTCSADWYDFSLKIDTVSINYTKSTFDILIEYSVELNQLVYWNSSVNLTEFESQFTGNVINFTLPYEWSVSDVLNESSSISYSTISSYPVKVVIVTSSSATNGKWKVIASSTNYGSSLSSYIGGTPTTLANFSNEVSFRAVFDGDLSGEVNLSVYDPSQNMMYTYVNSSVLNKQIIYFPSYDLSDNVTEYGIYSMQAKWMNDTHIGYWEQKFTILADTELNLINPAQNTVFNPSDTFTITLYFEDSGFTTPIDDATVYYNIDGAGQQSISTNNGTLGYYEISVDCNLITGDGDKTVEITSNKSYYNNSSLNYDFHINIPPEIQNSATIQGDSRWTQDEDFGSFNFDFTSFESDIEDITTDLDWYVTELDTSLIIVSGQYSDTDILTFNSVSNVFGSDTFTLWLIDSGGLTDSVSITITVNSVNDAPIIQNPSIIQGNSSWTQEEDFGSFPFYLTAYESDIENSGTNLDWYITGLDTSLVTVSGEYSNNDVLTFSSVSNAYGSDTFILWLIDSGGLTDSVSITITVNSVNDAPVIQNPSTIQGNSSWTQNEDFGSFPFYLSAYESDIENSGTSLDWYITGLDTSLVTVSGEYSNNDVLTFSSVSNAYGSDTFILWLIDSGGLTDSVSINIIVNPINDDPIIQNPSTIQGNSSWTQNEDFGTFNFYLSPYESDIEDSGISLDWYITGLDTSLVTVSGEYSNNDILAFSSVFNAYGSDTFTLWLIDSGGLTNSVSITITVNSVNDAPAIQNPSTIQGNSSWTQEEDFGSFNFYLNAYESDIEDSGISLDWYITGLDTSLVTVSGEYSNNDVLTFSSVSNAYGSDSFTLWLVDSGGLTDSVSITITVNSVNDVPVIQNPSTIQGNSSWMQNEDFGAFNFYLSTYESDIEDSGTNLDWYITGLDTSLVTVSGEYSNTDVLTFNSVLNAYGSDTFTLWLIDSGELTDSVSITITVNTINDNPAIQNPSTIQGDSRWSQDEDFLAFIFDFTAFESDIEDSGTDLDWYITGLDTSLVTISGEYSDSDIVTFTSVSNAFGTDTFTLWLIDSGGLTDSVAITIIINPINDDPTILSPSIIQGDSRWTQDEDFGFFTFDFTAFESDLEDSTTNLDWYITGLDNSLVILSGEYSDTDILTFTSVSNAFGSDTFTLWLTDSGGLTDSVSITITVSSVNDNPVIQNPSLIQGNSSWTQDEDFGSFQFYLSGFESDVEDSGTSLDWYTTGIDISLVTLSGEFSNTDMLVFSSVSNAFGIDTFTLWLIDSGGLIDSVSMTITVNAINDAPVILNPSIIQGDSRWTQDEDFGSFVFDFTPYESDVESSTTDLDWYVTGLNTSLVTVSGGYSDNDVLTIHSVINAHGTDVFTLWLVDLGGSTDSIIVTITVDPINDAPVILNPLEIQSNSSWVQGEDFGSFIFDFTPYESDVESSSTDLDWYITGLNTSLVLVSGENSSNDVLTFSSVEDAIGTDLFTVWLVDANGATDSVIITIYVGAENDNPIISDPLAIQNNPNWTQSEDFGQFQIDLTGNETDVEDSGTALDWYITGLDTSLVTVSGEYSDDDVLIFYSVANAFGTDSFTLWLIDSGGFTDSVQITIQLTGINDAPWISDKSIIISNETWNQWENFGVFEFYLKSYENDVDHGDSQLTWSIDLGYTLFQFSGYDSVTDIITFGSLLNTVGYESFTLRLTDGEDLFDTVEVYINITGTLDISVSSSNLNSIYYNDEIFDIQVYVYGITRSVAIPDAIISYSIMGAAYTSENVVNLGAGYYNITVFVWDQSSLGQIDITIKALKTNFVEDNTVYSYFQYIRTTQSINETDFKILWAENVTISAYFFNNESIGISGAIIEWDAGNPVFSYSWKYISSGLYELELNSSPVIEGQYSIHFNISLQWYLVQQFTVNILVNLPTNYIEVSIYHQIPGYNGNLTSTFDGLIAYKFFNNITFEFSYIDTNNSNQFIPTASTASMYVDGVWNSDAVLDLFNEIYVWVLDLDSFSFGDINVSFILDGEYYQEQRFYYNISLQKLTGEVQFDSILQFGQIPDYISSRYVLYSGATCRIQYTFLETTYDIPAAFTSVNLTIVGTNYWFEVDTDAYGTAIWNIPVNLFEGDYTFRIELNPDEFNPLSVDLYITASYRDSIYQNLEAYDFGHTLDSAGLNFEYAYRGNDLIIDVEFLDSYTISTIPDGIVYLQLGLNTFNGGYNAGKYSITIPESYIIGSLLDIDLYLNKTYFVNTSVSFTVDVTAKNEIRISSIETIPSSITARSEVTFRFLIENRPDGSSQWSELTGVPIEFQFGEIFLTQISNGTGVVSFTFTAPTQDQTSSFTVHFAETYDSEEQTYSGTVIITTPKPLSWVPYAGTGGGVVLTVLFSIALIVARKRRRSKRMIKDMEQKIEEKEIVEEEETFEDLLEKEESIEESPKKSIEENESEEQPDEIEEEKGSEDIDIEDKTEKELNQKDEILEDTQPKDIVEEPTKKGDFSLEDPIDQNIEKMLLQQITEQTVRSKNDLWNIVQTKLDELGINPETDQIQEIFEKLQKEKKIWFDTKTKPVGWKLK